MGRWRPPAEKSSPYITPGGLARLRTELTDLWAMRRREVVPALSAAAAEGDRSENAEYIYRKKQLAGIDRRIRYLTRRIDEVQVVDRPPARPDRVYFGAEVTLDGPGSVRLVYRIAGADEIDAERGWISIDSPLARALLGKETGARVRVDIGERTDRYEIVAVAYPVAAQSGPSKA
jgi:transcription elongation factor GreB